MDKRPIKLLRITTVPMSLRFLLRGQMRYMKSKGFEVVVASAEGSEVDDIENYEEVDHYSFPLTRRITPLTDLKALIEIVQWMRKEKFDIVHSHTPKAGLIAMLAARIAKVPLRMHTIAGLPWMESRGLKRKLLKKVDQLAFAAATHVYLNSKGLLEFAQKERLASPTKLKVLAKGSTNGIDLDIFDTEKVNESKDELRREVGIKSNDFVYCFIGRIVGDKGINELYEAMIRLPERIKLILVGPFEAELDPVLPEARQFFEMSKRVRVVGYQNDVRPYLKMSDALVFPSYREGFPNVPMQAGAMGLPCIVSDINGCNEIVEDQVNGLIVHVKNANDLENSMYKLAADQNLYERLAANARSMISDKFCQIVVWEALYAEYIALAESKLNV